MLRNADEVERDGKNEDEHSSTDVVDKGPSIEEWVASVSKEDIFPGDHGLRVIGDMVGKTHVEHLRVTLTRR